MENKKMYLIHEDDYIRHIDEKLELYAMLRQMASAVKKLPEMKSTRDAKQTADIFSTKAMMLYEGWDIPDRYLITADTDDLRELMENELCEPEDAGFIPDDGDCPCCGGERCCEYAERIEDEYFNESEPDEDEGDEYAFLSELLEISHEVLEAMGLMMDAIADVLDDAD